MKTPCREVKGSVGKEKQKTLLKNCQALLNLKYLIQIKSLKKRKQTHMKAATPRRSVNIHCLPRTSEAKQYRPPGK